MSFPTLDQQQMQGAMPLAQILPWYDNAVWLCQGHVQHLER